MTVKRKSVVVLDHDDLVAQARAKMTRIMRYVGNSVLADLSEEYVLATNRGEPFSIDDDDIEVRYVGAFARKYGLQ